MQTGEGTTIARLSGIYGPGREGLMRLVVAGRPVQESPPLYSNRIHRDDAAAALVHLLMLENPEDIYIVTDDLPVAKYEVVSWLARQMGCPAPEKVTGHNAVSGKKTSNQRLRDSGLKLQYPNYQAGYSQIFEAIK